jgi:hypothetical protein
MASKRSNGIRNLAAFPLDTGLSKPQRVASLLDWWAEKQRYDFLGYNEITKAVNGYKHMPRMDTEEVAVMRGLVGRAGKILQKKYKRALVRHRALGARATFDSVDAIRHKAVERTKKIERDIVALSDLDEIIDLKSITDTPENRPLKQWYQRDVKGILKQVASPEFRARMLPPAQKDDEA